MTIQPTPIATTEIENITPISLVQHKGSTCITYVSNGTLIHFVGNNI